MSELKQVILVRQDLKLPKGKLATQVAHASVNCILKMKSSPLLDKWEHAGMKKVVLKVKDKDELLKFFNEFKRIGIKTSLIKDAGKTVVEPGTMTCVGAGPYYSDDLDKLVGHLKLV